MNPSKLSYCLVLVAVVLAGCVSETRKYDADAMVASATALDEAFVAAFNDGDAAALSELYWNSPDVVSFPPGTLELHGRDAIREDNAAFFSAMPGTHLELTESHHMVAGDVVIAWGMWRITMPGAEGEPLVGRYTDVKAQRDGQWVYLLDHASAPAPPLPPTE